jgi:hypothetical protein
MEVTQLQEVLGRSSSSSNIATDGQSTSSSWCRAPFRAHVQILIFFVWQLLLHVGRPLWQEHGSVTFSRARPITTYYCLIWDSQRGPCPDFNCLCLTITSSCWAPSLTRARVCNVQSRKTHNHILLSHLRFPQPGGPGTVFICPRNRVALLYPGALGSLYVASYDSQGYSGGILTLRHTGHGRDLIACFPYRKRRSQQFYCCLYTLCRRNVSVRQLPSNYGGIQTEGWGGWSTPLRRTRLPWCTYQV